MKDFQTTSSIKFHLMGPIMTISSMHSHAPLLRGAFTRSKQSHSLTPTDVTLSVCEWQSGRERRPYAALRLASIRLRLIRHSAICTALSAAPLRKLSETHHSVSPFSTVGSSRMRLI